MQLQRPTTRHRGTGTISANIVAHSVGIFLVLRLHMGVSQVRDIGRLHSVKSGGWGPHSPGDIWIGL